METKQSTFRSKERVKLLAYEDVRLGVPVFVDLVYATGAQGLDHLAQQIHLRDVVEVVRKAHEKLPHHIEIRGAELEQEQVPTGERLSFDLPAELFQKRFVFPAAFKNAVSQGLFLKDDFTALKSVVVGRGQGAPLEKFGILGRAAVEEQSGTNELPLYYATLLLILRDLSEHVQEQLASEGEVKNAFDIIKRQLVVWNATLKSRVRQPVLTTHLIENPLTLYALNRQRKRVPVEEVTKKYLEYPNEYNLTPQLAHEFDEFFSRDAKPAETSDDPHEHHRLRAFEAIKLLWSANVLLMEYAKARRTLTRLAILLGSAIAAGLILPWLLTPLVLEMIQAKLLQPQFTERFLTALPAGLATGGGLLLLGKLYLFFRLRYKPVFRNYRRLRKDTQRNRPLRQAIARALARAQLTRLLSATRREDAHRTLTDLKSRLSRWKDAPQQVHALLRRAERADRLSSKVWVDDLPRLLWSYLKLKVHQLEYQKLAAVTLPPVVFSDMYTTNELHTKWKENACVCYDNEFPSLMIGAANVAAVYFIDVAGSAELSTQQALSNALEFYTRILPLANEMNGKPLWRKEVGDGRYYCYPIQEALRRAVLTAQGCAHPKVGIQAGIGLSVGEIYTDVTTGDFLNETANRASRLNGRDEIVAAYIQARYIQKPFRVYVKYGRLHNTGIAMDEKALHALNVSGWEAHQPVPPIEWRFPLLADDGSAGQVSLFVERLDPAVVANRLTAMGNPPQFEQLRQRLNQALVFEVFCHKSQPDLKYQTPLEGRSPQDYLQTIGVERAAFSVRDIEREAPVTYLPVALPSGQMINLVVKHEKASLKGLGTTAIAEVSLPNTMQVDDLVLLEKYLANL